MGGVGVSTSDRNSKSHPMVLLDAFELPNRHLKNFSKQFESDGLDI